MGLFAKGTKTTTTVRPNAKVEQILKDVASRTGNMDPQFVAKQIASMSPSQISSLNQMADSGEVNSIANTLMSRTQTGLQQQSEAAQRYREAANTPITGGQINQASSNLMRQGGLLNRANTTAQNAGLTRDLGGGDAARRAQRLYGNQQNAINTFSQRQSLNSLALNNADQRAKLAQSIIGAGQQVGAGNQALGQQGLALNQLGLQNKMNAGNMLQNYQNAVYNNAWENANAQNRFAWDQLNNRLNVANQLNPMVGYTTKGNMSAPSMSSQIAGAAMTGLGIAGKMGAFQSAGPFAGLNQQQTNNAYEQGLKSSGGFAGVDTPETYQNNMNAVRNAGTGSFWNTNIGQGISNGYNTVKGWF